MNSAVTSGWFRFFSWWIDARSVRWVTTELADGFKVGRLINDSPIKA
jgi:hypothetical protein